MNLPTLLIVACLALASSSANAIGCGPSKSISEAVKAGDEFVFKGRVRRVLPTLGTSDVLPVEFSVSRRYRGRPPQILTVYFFPAYDPRPLAFHEGDDFLISTQPFKLTKSSNSEPVARSSGTACTLRTLVRMAH